MVWKSSCSHHCIISPVSCSCLWTICSHSVWCPCSYPVVSWISLWCQLHWPLGTCQCSFPVRLALTFIVVHLPGNAQLCHRGFLLSFEGRPKSRFDRRWWVGRFSTWSPDPQNMGFGGSQSLMPLGEDQTLRQLTLWSLGCFTSAGLRFWCEDGS